MFGFGYLSSAIADWMKKESTDHFTIGKVIDTNDPDQVGRIRVRCGGWNDSLKTPDEDLPWAIPISPLAGVTSFGRRGATQDKIDGPVAYGMWNIPKVGSFVLVGCFDGNRGRRFYVGGIHPHLATHTLPHGRWMWNEDLDEGMPEGPIATNEAKIEPTHTNLTDQFTKRDSDYIDGATPSDARRNLEFRTRGADMQATAIHNRHIASPDSPGSLFADHAPGDITTIQQEDTSTRQVLGSGYTRDQHEPEDGYPTTGGVNYDSHTYSWTTPGFHSISMNDRADNCRIRVRTTAGHQILMDDTNERIYISTAGGESWIEIDQVGNIDIYASKNISTHAGGDINFTSDKTIRMQAKEGFHMRTDGEFRIHSLQDFHVRTEMNIRTYSGEETRMESTQDMHVKVIGSTFISSTGPIHVGTEGTMHLSSQGRLNLTSSEFIVGDASQIHWNSAKATAATSSQEALEIQANLTTRVPDHEPWARMFMKEDLSDATATDKVNSQETEYPYTNKLIGRQSTRTGAAYGPYTRNDLWNR